MTCQEAEALSLLFQKHLAKVSVSKTYLTGICNRSRDTEGLKTLTDSSCSVSSLTAALLDCDCCTNGVSPASILKTDRLDTLDLSIYIQSCILCNLLCLFDRSDTIAIQNRIDLVNTSLIGLK